MTDIFWFEPEPECFHFYFDTISIKKFIKTDINITKVSLLPSLALAKNHKYDDVQILNSELLHCIIHSPLVIIDGYRFSDKYVLALRSMLGLRTIYIQHGRYTDLKRNFLSKHLLRKIKAFTLLPLQNNPLLNLRLLAYCIHCIIKKRNLFKITGLLYEQLNYWISFHKQKNYVFETVCSINDRDFDEFRIDEERSDTVLYCAQTLYEDGRISKTIYNHFLRYIDQFFSSNDISLVVRPHPRSNIKHLKAMISNALYSTSNKLPRPLYVITHNSAIATIFLMNNIPVVFFKVNNELLPAGLEDHPLSICVKNFASFKYSNHLEIVKRSYGEAKVEKKYLEEKSAIKVLENQILLCLNRK